MQICRYVHVCTCICKCGCMHSSISMPCVCVCVQACRCVDVCVCVCMCVCVCARVRVSICSNPDNVLRHYFTAKRPTGHNLRPRAHSFALPSKDPRNFVSRTLSGALLNRD